MALVTNQSHAALRRLWDLHRGSGGRLSLVFFSRFFNGLVDHPNPYG